ncbi:MAG: CPBP family intramembrane metalloprotease, partial [Deltaproteobacteria bacterium]|nr:CPBP family intramembrane metalloprotease [Deltaproteobacteria bacterium]
AMWLALGLPHAAFAALHLRRLYRQGALTERLGLRRGDFTIGLLLGALIFAAAAAARHVGLGQDARGLAWLFRLSLQLGLDAPGPQLLAGLAALGALEELTWRGLVLDALEPAVGSRRAFAVTALLYAGAHLPTAWTLGDPAVGANPLLVLAAAGAGLPWSFAASMLGRLTPVVISHAAFSYFAVAWLIPRVG